jgi:hypothetical protein
MPAWARVSILHFAVMARLRLTRKFVSAAQPQPNDRGGMKAFASI